MFSSTAAQVRNHPSRIQPRYGKMGDAQTGSRSRRITRPKLTALSATTVNAIVMEVDGVLGTRLAGTPRQHGERAERDEESADQPPHDLGLVTIRVPGRRGGRCITPGSGTSTTKPITTVTTTKSLQNSNIIGNSATPSLMLKMVASSISCSTDDRMVSCSLMYDEIRR